MSQPRTGACYLLLLALLTASCSDGSQDQGRPNILWITSEDNSPYLGCYGDELAQTPSLDGLAAEGVRYRNAFANAPVCSSARSTLITGMYATSLGVHNHRSGVTIPPSFRFYPQLLREAGYYCTNNVKTDYNVLVDGRRNATFFWDESSNQAHYRNRQPGQPFFAVFNITVSHEGQTTDENYMRRGAAGALPTRRVVPPDKVDLPPYHPDTPVMRENWSRYYDNLWLMDEEVGRILNEIKTAGLADDTIIFYYSDHGGALPRGKRNIHDSGTRVPLIIRFPEKWSHLAPAKPGEWEDRPVSFVDFPATVLSMAGIPIPDNYQGRPFLGDQMLDQDFVFLFRARMDERYDNVRAIRTRDHLYVNNFTPHRPWGQYYSYPFQVMASMNAWHDACASGECTSIQNRYWQEKPAEEFYLVRDDPFQVNNSIDVSSYADIITEMQHTLRDKLIETRDAGLIPEGMYSWLPGDRTVHEYAQSESYPIEQVVHVATIATSRDSSHLAELAGLLDDPHPVIRYWAVTGCLVLRDQAAPLKDKLRELLGDTAADIRVVAAEALGNLGDVEAATATLADVLRNGNPYEALAAITVVELFARSHLLPIERAKELVAGTGTPDAQRVFDWIQSLN